MKPANDNQLSPNAFTHYAKERAERGRNAWERLALFNFHMRYHPSWTDGGASARRRARQYMDAARTYEAQRRIAA